MGAGGWRHGSERARLRLRTSWRLRQRCVLRRRCRRRSRRMFRTPALAPALLHPPSRRSGRRTPCPGRPRRRPAPRRSSVLHNDHIGHARRAQGRLHDARPQAMTCARAAKRCAPFLQDFDGRLPAPWTIDQPTATFLRGTTGAGFSIARAAPQPDARPERRRDRARRGPVPRLVHRSSTTTGSARCACPAGPYRITLASCGRPSCAKGAALARAASSTARPGGCRARGR